MEGSLTADARRIIGIVAFVGIVLIFVSGLILGAVPQYISVIGGVAALAAWAFALVTAIRARQTDWIVILVIALALGALLALITLSDITPDADSIPQVGALPVAFITTAYATLGAGPALERGTSAYCGAWALLVLVIGGTLVGGAIGTNIGAAAPYITAVGFHLYMVAGVLALFTWAAGLILSFRTGAWGWFALVVLLPAVGAFMFGLFGPTRSDVEMAREHVRQRRAVGLQ